MKCSIKTHVSFHINFQVNKTIKWMNAMNTRVNDTQIKLNMINGYWTCEFCNLFIFVLIGANCVTKINIVAKINFGLLYC